MMTRTDNTSLWLIGGGIFLSLLFGAMISIMPPLIVVAIVGVIAILIFAVKNPYIGLLAALVLIFEIVPADMQPGLQAGGGKLKPYDIMVAFLLFVVLLRSMGQKDLLARALGPTAIPYIYFFSALGISLVFVKYYAPDSTMRSAITELRSYFMWLLLPLITLGVDSKSRFKYFVLGIALIGFVVASYVSAESLLGLHITTQARVEQLDSGANTDIVRSIAGGGIYVIIFTMLLGVNMLLDRRLSIWIAIPIGAVLCAGLAVQYGRGVWVATIFGLAFSSYIYRGWAGLFKAMLICALAVGVLLTGASVVRPRVAEALIERATGIGGEIENGGSFGFRKTENSYAFRAIEKSPFFGVGLGGTYKRVNSMIGFESEAQYIHNAYLWFPLKLGVWASFIPFGFIIAFFVLIYRGTQLAAGGAEKRGLDRAFLGAVGGAYVVPVITSYTQPEWGNPQGIGSMCVLIGCAILYLKFGSPFADEQTFPPADTNAQPSHR